MSNGQRIVASVMLRSRRRVTLPPAVCDAFGVKPGDRFVLEVSEGRIIARSQRQAALHALPELRRGFAESGVSLKELLEGGRQVRDEIFRERYPDLAKRHGI